MLQVYFLNLLNKHKRGALFGGLLILFFIIPKNSLAQNGFYNNFEELIKISKTNYLKKLEKLTTNLSELNDLTDPNLAELDPDFINTMIFYTPSRYSALVAKDKCSLYDVILADLAQSHEGDIRFFIVRYKSDTGEVKTVAVNRNIFMDKVAYAQCPSIQRFFQYFNLANVEKTLKTITLPTPKSDEECKEIHRQFVEDYKTPYLCKISDHVKQIPRLTLQVKNTSKSNYRELQRLKRELRIASKYQEILNGDAVDYLESLCANIEKPQLFCDSFFKSSFWERAETGEKSQFYIYNMCRDHLNKADLTKKQLAKCSREFTSEENLCHYLGKQEKVLLPKSNCEELSQRLNRSKLYSDYYDCPAEVANDGIINVTRILNHFEKDVYVNKNSCNTTTTNVFARFVNESTDGRLWNVKACYQDKIYDREECFPMVYGDIPGSELSISNVIKRVLSKTKGFGASQTCEFVAESVFQPRLLKYKNGCFIIYDPNNCYGTECKFKIVLNEREVDNIKITSGSNFDYYPKDFQGANYSLMNLIKARFKLQSKSIINIAFLKQVFKDHPDTIIHGVACAEDLLPNFYRKRVLNQCRPLPFLVDGYKEDKGLVSVIMRTAHDSLHAPRLVPWSYLYSSLKDYQRRHPLNQWGLNALFK
tara:strand:- start:33744 stop:35690 length:1947 start_codon:yes stop_codon:yes gene_type:complete